MQVAGVRNYSGKEVQIALKNSSMKDRASYASKNMKNVMKTTFGTELSLAAGAGATFAATNYVAKNKPAQEFLAAAGKAIAHSNVGKFFGESLKEIAPALNKAASWAKGLPGPAKAVLAIGSIITLGAINKLSNKYFYNQGKIDQNLVDKTKVKM